MQKNWRRGGSVKILTDLDSDSARFKEILASAAQAGFELSSEAGKTYFPRDWSDPDFTRKPQMVMLALKKVTNA